MAASLRGQSEHSAGLLLRSVDYGDADRVVTLLTASHGKIALIARGARRSRRRFQGALEPFTWLDVALVPGAGVGLGTLVEAHARRAFPRILADLARMGAAGAVLELVRDAVPERETDAPVYLTTAAALEALDVEDAVPLALVTCFHARLLGLLGFALRLDACGQCGRRPESRQASLFDPREGRLVCRACGGASQRISADARARLARALTPSWIAAAAPPWPRRSLGPAYRAMRAFAEHRLGKQLPDPPLLVVPAETVPQ